MLTLWNHHALPGNLAHHVASHIAALLNDFCGGKDDIVMQQLLLLLTDRHTVGVAIRQAL